MMKATCSDPHQDHTHAQLNREKPLLFHVFSHPGRSAFAMGVTKAASKGKG